MRIGRWLYHYDPNVQQAPQFQVKNAAVRITAFIGDPIAEVPLQFYVGDGPGDPNGRWETWARSGQRIAFNDRRLTQLIIAQAGYYRLDPNALAALPSTSRAMFWLEDEEGTLDDKTFPVHIIRADCSLVGTPPPVDAIRVRCEELVLLANTGSLTAGRWYAITDPVDRPADGGLIYVFAVSENAYSTQALMWNPSLTGNVAWPAVITPGAGCRLLRLIDPVRHNDVRGNQTINQWDWWNPRNRNNVISDTLFVGEFLPSIESSTIRNSVIYCRLPGRYEISGLEMQSSSLDLTSAEGGTVLLSQAVITAGSRVYLASCMVRGLAAHNYSTITIAGDSRVQYQYRVSAISADSGASIELVGSGYRQRAINVNNVRAESRSVLRIERPYDANFYPSFYNISCTTGSYVQMIAVQSVRDMMVSDRAMYFHRPFSAAYPWRRLEGPTVENVRLTSGAYFNVVEQSPSVEYVNEPSFYRNIHMSSGGTFSVPYPYVRTVLNNANIDSAAILNLTVGSPLADGDITGSLYFSDINMSDASIFSTSSSKIQWSQNIRLLSMHDGSMFYPVEARTYVYSMSIVGGSRFYKYKGYEANSTIRGVSLNGGSALLISDIANIYSMLSQVTLSGGASIDINLNGVSQYTYLTRVTAGSGANVYVRKPVANGSVYMSGLDFGGGIYARINFRTASFGRLLNSTLHNNSLTIDLGTGGNTFMTVSHLYHFGNTTYSRTFTGNFTGTALKNF